VQSTVGKGSTFTVHLPASYGDPLGLGEGPPVEVEHTERDRRRVLVVEDDAAMRRVACRILDNAGYDVLEAGDAEDALVALEQRHGDINLLLTDVVMPGASGWDLHTTVAERWPGIPTLFMSGYTDDHVRRENLAGAGIEFIAKPFDASGLLAAVAAHAD
jgi:DNA-binding NtrC family response regulator